MSSFTFCDLFAGLGGFHVALERLGGRCVFASEIKPHLRQLYERNFHLAPHGDIRSVRPSDIPDHDVLTAGFPCQAFSKAGDQLGFECSNQGNLFFDVIGILKKKRPRYFILENVPNLLKHDAGKTWEYMERALSRSRGLGYDVRATRLSPHHFGVPQTRDRLYIVGSLQSLDTFSWPEPTEAVTSIESVLDDRPHEARALSASNIACLEAWNAFLRKFPKRHDLPSFPLWSMEWGATYPYEETTPYALLRDRGYDGLRGFRSAHGRQIGYLRSLADRWESLPGYARTPERRFPTWKQMFIRQNRAFYEAHKSLIDGWRESILEFHSSRQKFEWNVKGGERDLWQHLIQLRASGVRVKRRATAPSLVAMSSTQVPIIGWERRYMTPRECARLQSLGELEELPAGESRVFHALGNAVNATVVEHIAQALLNTAGNARCGDSDRLPVEQAA